MSDTLQTSGVYWLAGLLGLLVLGQRLLKNPAMRLRWDKTLLRLPVTGRVARGLNTARFSRTLSILTASSVPLLEGIQTAAAVSANRYVEQQLLLAADRVREGSSLRAALAELRLFPPMMLYMTPPANRAVNWKPCLNRPRSTRNGNLIPRWGWR